MTDEARWREAVAAAEAAGAEVAECEARAASLGQQIDALAARERVVTDPQALAEFADWRRTLHVELRAVLNRLSEARGRFHEARSEREAAERAAGAVPGILTQEGQEAFARRVLDAAAARRNQGVRDHQRADRERDEEERRAQLLDDVVRRLP